jgi:hypothetical protein
VTNPTAPRELTYQERATWGECPVCHAKHGEWCNGAYGIALGRNVNGELPEQGAHLGRLQRAPKRVRMVACE